jgi:DNA end-binding protein Ku
VEVSGSPVAAQVARMKKVENRLLPRAASKRIAAFADTYRAATGRERCSNGLFHHPARWNPAVGTHRLERRLQENPFQGGQIRCASSGYRLLTPAMRKQRKRAPAFGTPVGTQFAGSKYMAATVWKGSLSFGLVSFPIRLFAAARAETVHFHMLHNKDKSRIKEVWYCAEENKPVPKDEIVKGYEYSKGKFVVVDDEELKKVAPPTATAMEILQFVKAGEVDPVYLEKSYYVAPDPAGAKPYGLLLKAMSDTGYDAVAKVAMHAREHIVIIRPQDDALILHTMYFEDELHGANKTKSVSNAKFTAKEMDLARRLIDTLASPFKPQLYKDEYRENIERLIDQKRKGREVTEVAKPKPEKVVDILDALKRSLENSSRPPKPTAKKKAVKRKGKAA